MIFVILGILAFVGAVFYNSKQTNEWNEFSLGFVAFIIALCILFANVLGMFLVGFRDKPIETHNIKSLSDGQATRGSFFLGSGVLDDVPTYFYYAEVGERQYRQKTAPASRVTIREDSSEKPHVEKVGQEFDTNFWFSFMATGDRSSRHDRYVFVVPEGSVIQNYTLDTSAK